MTLHAGIAGGADIILLPEIPYDIDVIVEAINKRGKAGKHFTIIAVAEGAISKEDAKLSKKDLKAKKAKEKYPSVAYELAEKVQKKAAKVGFDWTEQKQIADKIGEEYGELREAMKSGDEDHIDEELGDLLFAAANLSRFRKRDSAELLLARATAKFRRRFSAMENMLRAEGRRVEDCSAEEMNRLWNKVKNGEKR